MRKRNKGRKLSRSDHQRKALLNTMAGSLFLQGKIRTTEAKAKELRVVAEKFISRAKKDTVANRRLLAANLAPAISQKLFKDIAPQYLPRQGGYIRIIKLGLRKSDGAKMAIIELVK